MRAKFHDMHWSCSELGCDEWGAWVLDVDREGVKRYVPATGDIPNRKCHYHGPSRAS